MVHVTLWNIKLPMITTSSTVSTRYALQHDCWGFIYLDKQFIRNLSCKCITINKVWLSVFTMTKLKENNTRQTKGAKIFTPQLTHVYVSPLIVFFVCTDQKWLWESQEHGLSTLSLHTWWRNSSAILQAWEFVQMPLKRWWKCKCSDFLLKRVIAPF